MELKTSISDVEPSWRMEYFTFVLFEDGLEAFSSAGGTSSLGCARAPGRILLSPLQARLTPYIGVESSWADAVMLSPSMASKRGSFRTVIVRSLTFDLSGWLMSQEVV